MIPRRVTITTGFLLLICAALIGAFLLMRGALLDHARDLRETELQLAFVEGHLGSCQMQADDHNTIIIQCLAWQKRLSFEMGSLERACLGDDTLVAGGAW